MTMQRGFAAMPKKQVLTIAAMGGRAAHEKGVAHEWTSAEASKAGRKGAASRKAKVLAAREAAAQMGVVQAEEVTSDVEAGA